MTKNQKVDNIKTYWLKGALMDIMLSIRKKTQTEEIDYLFLLDCLSHYKHPRDKITKLLKSKQLIRIKKGIYIFGQDYRRRPYSLKVLANMIYGPSYVSYEYALSYYHLIPEKVTRITNACTKRNKYFSTPVGDFDYFPISSAVYPIGITLQFIDENTSFLIATKEKALTDLIAKTKYFQTKNDLFEYLTESLRIIEEELFHLNIQILREIAQKYNHRNVDLLCEILQK